MNNNLHNLSREEVMPDQFEISVQDYLKDEESKVEKSNSNVIDEKAEELSINLVDLNAYIDCYAEQESLKQFDTEMAEKNKGFLGKIGGFLTRSIKRVGRGSYIESLKQQKRREIEGQLKNGILNVTDIKSFVVSSENAIREQNYLEEEKETFSVDVGFRDILINEVLNETGSNRDNGIEKLYEYILVQNNNKKIDKTQLENTITEIESKKITKSDLNTLRLGLNFFNIGGIGNEREGNNGEKRVGLFTRALDFVDKKLGKTPGFFGKIARGTVGVLRNPTIAAVGAAVGIKSVTTASYAVGFGGGLLAGSLFAGVRGTRERRDHHVLAQRELVTGGDFKTNKKFEKDFEKLNNKTDYHDANDIINFLNSTSEDTDKKKELALEYLARRKSTIDTGRNWIIYHDKNTTELNTQILRLIKNLDDDKDWFKKEQDAIDARVQDLKSLHIELSGDERKIYKKYGAKQGLQFAAVGAVVGLSVGAILDNVINPDVAEANTTNANTTNLNNTNTVNTNVANPTHPDLFNEQVNRTHLDNNTRNFDKNELRLWGTKDGGLTIEKMISKASWHNDIVDTITTENLKNGNAFALVTVGDEIFKVAIDGNGVLQPSEFLEDVIKNRSYKFVEIVKENTSNGHNIFATAVGNGKGVVGYPLLTPSVEEFIPREAPVVPPVFEKPIETESFSKWFVPIGFAPYHEGGTNDGKYKEVINKYANKENREDKNSKIIKENSIKKDNIKENDKKDYIFGKENVFENPIIIPISNKEVEKGIQEERKKLLKTLENIKTKKAEKTKFQEKIQEKTKDNLRQKMEELVKKIKELEIRQAKEKDFGNDISVGLIGKEIKEVRRELELIGKKEKKIATEKKGKKTEELVKKIKELEIKQAKEKKFGNDINVELIGKEIKEVRRELES